MNYTLITNLKEEIYVRNKSYATMEEFKREIVSSKPHKIDFGAVYVFPVRFIFIIILQYVYKWWW